MEPIKFDNVYHEKIWGGRDLGIFRNNLPDGKIGESWDVACHKHGMSTAVNGEFKGKTLREIIDLKGAEIVGKKIPTDWFPLLIKMINAKDKLSVQVHPTNDYAKKVEGEMGKTEVWYVVEAFEGASLIVGTNDCTKEQFKEAIENGKLDKYMHKVNVKKGDVYFVKSGLIHGIGAGVIVAEIQQNSDTTYRVYDYNRGRELHVKKALDVVNLNLKGERSRGVEVPFDGYRKIYYCLCDNFSLELYDVQKSFEESSDEDRFFIFTDVDGEGKINYDGGSIDIKMGDSVLIPASLGKYQFEGRMKVLKSYVPDVKKCEEEILKNVRY